MSFTEKFVTIISYFSLFVRPQPPSNRFCDVYHTILVCGGTYDHIKENFDFFCMSTNISKNSTNFKKLIKTLFQQKKIMYD